MRKFCGAAAAEGVVHVPALEIDRCHPRCRAARWGRRRARRRPSWSDCHHDSESRGDFTGPQQQRLEKGMTAQTVAAQASIVAVEVRHAFKARGKPLLPAGSRVSISQATFHELSAQLATVDAEVGDLIPATGSWCSSGRQANGSSSERGNWHEAPPGLAGCTARCGGDGHAGVNRPSSSCRKQPDPRRQFSLPGYLAQRPTRYRNAGAPSARIR